MGDSGEGKVIGYSNKGDINGGSNGWCGNGG